MENDSFCTDPRLLDLVVEWEESRESGAARSLAEICAGSPELLVPLQELVERLAAIDRKLTKSGFKGEWARQDPEGNAPASIPPMFPGFEVLEELGRGGMGIVYKARQLSVGGRLVAIKTIRGGAWSSHSLAGRLRGEVQALARLNHEHVVKVYDVIDRDGLLSLVLEYVDGGSLAGREAGTAMPPREAARIAGTIAATMADVHRERILHRDLKPGNILRSRSGQIKITDFGLAKQLASESSHSQTGDIAGSPSYMAPEQALGKTAQIGERTDVYAIGATLYDLLTGRPPIVGATLLDTLDQVQRAEPVSPRLLVPQIPRDLETICLKCLEKEPQRRYGSAAALAADLDNFLSNRPVSARPLGSLGRVGRWAKRHPERALLVTGLIAVLVLVTGLGTWEITRLDRARFVEALQEQALAAEKQNARTQKFYAATARISERATRKPPGWTWDNRSDLGTVAPLRPADDDEALFQLRSEAVKALTAFDARKQRELLKGFDAYALAFSPDGQTLAVGANASEGNLVEIAIVDARTWQQGPSLQIDLSKERVRRVDRPNGIRSLTFTADGNALYVGTRAGWLHVFAWPERQPLRSWHAHDDYLLQIRLSADGRSLFTCSEDRSIKRWSVDGALLAEHRNPDFATDILLLDKGPIPRVAVASRQPTLLRQEDLKPTTDQNAWAVESELLALFPDGGGLIRATRKNLEVLGSVDLGLLQQVINRKASPSELHGLQISNDGQWLIVTSAELLQLWDLASMEIAAAFPAGGKGRIAAQFHPQHDLLAVSGNDRITLYELSDGAVCRSSLTGPLEIEEIALSPDGKSIAATAGRFGMAKNLSSVIQFAPASNAERASVRVVNAGVGNLGASAIAFTPDGRSAVVVHFGQEPRSLSLFDPKNAAVTGTVSGLTDPWRLCFSPDGRFAYLAARVSGPFGGAESRRPGAIHELDLKSLEHRPIWTNVLSEQEMGRSKILSLAAGKEWLICSSIDGRMRTIDRQTGKILAEREFEHYLDTIALSADGTGAVLGNRIGELLVVDVPGLTLRQTVDAHGDAVTAVATAGPDLILSGGRDQMLRFWQFKGGELHALLALGPFSNFIERLSVSSDGRVAAIHVGKETAVRLLSIEALHESLQQLRLAW